MKIYSNGSKWAGQEPDSVETLLGVIEKETLDPSFESYGNFVFKERHEDGDYHAFGNFLSVSHVFNISGSKEDIEPIRKAIRKAQKRPDYINARNN